MRYAEATAEITRLTKRLGSCDERGMPDLVCSVRSAHEDKHGTSTDSCRKWRREGPDGEWVSARELDEWCGPCVAVQAIVDERRAARRSRAAALAAIGNMGRALLRRVRKETTDAR